MILRKIILTICLLTITVSIAFSQSDSVSLATVIAKTAKFSNSYPIEKVYLHFDKPYYAVGDTIWFKAYVTVEQHMLSGLSKIVYVDMINSQDSIVRSLKLPVVSGVAQGNITLPQLSFNEGNYHVRAYTNWMRNFDNAYFFTKNIVVGNATDNNTPTNTRISFTNSLKGGVETINARVSYKDQDNIAYINRKVSWKVRSEDETIAKGKGTTDQNGLLEISFSSNKAGVFKTADLVTEIEINYKKSTTNSFSLKTASNPADVQFFPEGGDLVSGIRSKIAFKAINSSGLGIDIKGIIVDNDNKVVANIASQHFGMGVFILVPENGKSYKANITFPDGSQNSYDLPRVLDEGVCIAVNNSNSDTLNIKLSANAEFLQKFKNTRFYIVAQSGGVVYYAAQTALQNLVYSAAIPKSKFPTGILQLTLLSSDGDPLSERIVFIQHNDMLNISVNSDRTAYGPRQKVRMSVLAKSKNLPVAGSFSLAVVDETKVPFDENAETTILSSLLLTSDLKGYIEKPNYYFNHTDGTKLADLDVLMLTQGYRRFSYSDIIIDKNPAVTFFPEQGIDITGTLRTLSGIPLPKGNIHMVIPDKIYSTDAITDASGNFRFHNVALQDSSQVILNAKNNPYSKNLMLTADGDTYPKPLKNINAPDNVVNIDSTLSIYLKNSLKQYSSNRILKEVVIKAQTPVKKPSHTDYPQLVGLNSEADHTINSDQLTGCNFLLDCLKGAAFGLTFDNGEFYISRSYNQGDRSSHVQVYYNGMPVETNFLDNINPKTVESVEIFFSDGLSGLNRMSGTKGIMVVNSKKVEKGEKISLAQLKELIPQKNVITIMPMGFSKTREFYMPKYDATKTNTKPDLRTTIYWNPKIITDKTTGKASFDFFNTDSKGNYRAIIEGIDGEGNIGRYVYKYKVE